MTYPTILGLDILHELYLAKRRIYDMSQLPAGGYMMWLPDTFPKDEKSLRKGADMLEESTGIRPTWAMIDCEKIAFPARQKS